MVDVELQKPAEDAPKTVAKSATHFFLGTVLSRLSGFLREVALGAWFGATPLLAAFLIAYRFSQLLRRLFGETSLLSSFSPHFEHFRTHEPEQAAPFFRDLLACLSTFLIGLIVVLEVALFCAWKWGTLSGDNQEILFLTMIMLPGLLFICLYALFSALLQSDRKYFLPGISPLFFNGVLIWALWSMKEWDPAQATPMLAIAVVGAFCMQCLFVAIPAIPFLKTIRWNEVRLWTPILKKVAVAMGVTIVGVGAVQLNSLVDTLFARWADLSGPAYLYYAMRLYQLPLAFFGIALSSALLPPLARAREAGEHDRFLSLLRFALRRSLSLMIPMMAILFVCKESVVNFVYGRGVFDILTIMKTTGCLLGYTIGLVPAGIVLLLAPAFYAKKDFKTPFQASLISVIINLILNFSFIYFFHWRSASVAVATSIAAYLNAAYLVYVFSKKDGTLIDRETLVLVGKLITCTAIASIVTVWMIGVTELSRHFLTQFLDLATRGGLFAAVFLVSAWVMRISDITSLIRFKQASK